MLLVLILELLISPWLLGVSLGPKCVWDLVSSPSMGGGSFGSTWSGGSMPSSIGMLSCVDVDSILFSLWMDIVAYGCTCFVWHFIIDFVISLYLYLRTMLLDVN